MGGQTNHTYIHLPHATPNGQLDPLLLCCLVWASEDGVRVLRVIVITNHKPRAWLGCIDFEGTPYLCFLKCWFLDMQTNMHISLDKCTRLFETWMSWLLNQLVRFKYCIKTLNFELWAASRAQSCDLLTCPLLVLCASWFWEFGGQGREKVGSTIMTFIQRFKYCEVHHQLEESRWQVVKAKRHAPIQNHI